MAQKNLIRNFSEKKRNAALVLSGVLAGGALVFLAGVLLLRTSLVSERECAKSFDEAVSDIPRRIASSGSWTVRNVPCGMPPQTPGARIAVFELCNRKYAGKLIFSPDGAKVSSMIPCKIALYERNGKVWIARLNLPLFYRLVGGTPHEIFSEYIIPEQNAMFEGLLK